MPRAGAHKVGFSRNTRLMNFRGTPGCLPLRAPKRTPFLGKPKRTAVPCLGVQRTMRERHPPMSSLKEQASVPCLPLGSGRGVPAARLGIQNSTGSNKPSGSTITRVREKATRIVKDMKSRKAASTHQVLSQMSKVLLWKVVFLFGAYVAFHGPFIVTSLVVSEGF